MPFLLCKCEEDEVVERVFQHSVDRLPDSERLEVLKAVASELEREVVRW